MEQSAEPMGSFVQPKKRLGVGKMIGYLVLVLVVLGITYFGWKSYTQSTMYSVVYLQTGEIYVGKLSFFPKTTLRDPYILRVTKDEKDPKKNNFQLSPLKETVWNTKSLTLNKSHVVFYGLLDKNSQAAKALLEGPKEKTQSIVPNSPTTPASAPAPALEPVKIPAVK